MIKFEVAEPKPLSDDCGHHCGSEQIGNAPVVIRHCECSECHGRA